MLIVSVDGQAEPDRELTNVPYLDSVFRVIGAVTSTAIDRYGFETLIHARDMTKRLAAGLARRDCPREKKGRKSPAARSTITSPMSRSPISPTTNGARRFAAIPTGLTIADADVDALIAAGHDAVLCDADMREFFKGLPNVRMPADADALPAPIPAERSKPRPPTRIAARASRTDRP